MKDNNAKLSHTHEVYAAVFKKSVTGIRGILQQGRKCFRDYRRKPGKRFHIRCEDRVFMEESILPALACLPDGTTILFVGIEWYTSHYERYFYNSGVTFITCDIELSYSSYGSTMGHITSDIQNITRIMGLDVYDVVIITGVFGYGVDTEEQFHKTIENLYSIIKDKGILLVGWDRERSIEPNSRNIDIIRQYFDPIDGFLGLPFHKSFIKSKHEFHIFQKNVQKKPVD